MKKYYTTIDLQDGKFVGTVFSSSTNQEVYKTKPYSSQIQAVQDITGYLTGQQNTPQTITNTASHVPAPAPVTRGRCCGR